jgi:hypothetical protein
MPHLVRAYMRSATGHTPEVNSSESEWVLTVYSFEGKSHSVALSTSCISSGITKRSFTHTVTAKTVNGTLAEYGIIGGSAEQPTVGFTFQFLECFRQLHRVCPRLTLWGLATAIQHIHKVTLTVPITETDMFRSDSSARTSSGPAAIRI